MPDYSQLSLLFISVIYRSKNLSAYLTFCTPRMIGVSMYSIQPLWLVLSVLSSPAVAQGILNSVDSHNGDGESESSSTTQTVSSKGMIVLCTIVALVLVIGGMSLRTERGSRVRSVIEQALTILLS